MFKKMIVGCIVASVLALCVLVLIVSYSPKTLLTLVGKLTPYTAVVDAIEVTWVSPSLTIKQLQVSNHDKQTMVTIDDVSLVTTWMNWFRGKPQWTGAIESGSIYVDRWVVSEKSSVGMDSSSKQIPTATEIQEWIGMFGVSIHDITVHLHQDEKVNIADINVVMEKNSQKRSIDVDISYQKGDAVFPVKASMLSDVVDGTPTFIVDIPELDVGLFKHTRASSSVEDDEVNNVPEVALDWAWMSSLAPLDIIFRSDMLVFDQGMFTDIESIISMENKTESTITQRHSGNMKLSLSNDYVIDSPIQLSSTWHPIDKRTQGADVNGSIFLTLGGNQVTLEGDFNLNGIEKNQWQINSDILQFPVKATSLSAKQLQQQTQSFFPFSLKGNLQLNDSMAALTNMQLTAGRSDLNGQINIKTHAGERSEAVFTLQSSLLVAPTSPIKNKEATAPVASATIFTNNVIPLHVLDTMVVEGSLKVDTLIYNERVLLKDSESHLSLKNKSMSFVSQTDDFSGGKLNAQLLLNNQTGHPHLSLVASMQNALLESLAVLPKDEFKGGTANANISLNSQGVSTQALAESLNGDVLLVVREGTIANNSFELLGSDLILNMLNAINPFYKKVKNTQLECAVVKSKIKNGRLLFNDSIKVVTSKMIVVGDGHVDLATESIRVNINPKARSGVGVDVASLAKFVALKGTLSKPEVGASASGTLKSIASVGAAMSTGGLSLLAKGLLDKATAGKACDSALLAFAKEK
jgi:hypothetical protein